MFDLKKYVNGGSPVEICDTLEDGKDVSVLNAHFGQRTAIASLLPSFIYVCADYVMAKKAFDQLSCLRNAVYLPALDDVLTYVRIKAGDNITQRIKALYSIATGKAEVVVTHTAALMQLFPDLDLYREMCLCIKKGDSIQLTSLPSKLSKAGYKRVAHIDGVGQFAVRGDILDISPCIYDYGIRIEFFGDDVDEIKKFDYYSQLSLEKIDKVDICPNTIVTASDDVDLKAVKNSTDEIITDLCLMNGSNDNALSFIMPLLPHSTFEKFVNFPYIVFDDAKHVYDNAVMTMTEHNSRLKNFCLRQDPYVEGQLVDLNFGGRKLAFHNINSNNKLFTPQKVIRLQEAKTLVYRKNMAMLCSDVKAWSNEGYSIVMCCGEQRLLGGISDSLTRENAYTSAVTLTEDMLDTGFVFHDIRLVVIGTHDIVAKKENRIKKSNKDAFTMANVGDYVVHNVHGIGICESIQKMTLGSSTRDYVVIRYRDGDKLYLPVENMDSLSRYVSGEEAPKLNKIGGADFAKVKERVKVSVKDMAFSLLELYAARSAAHGYKYSKDNTLLEEFEAAFPYVPTEDQTSAVKDGLNDLMNGKIMDRLLCGDVGYGKTEVALRLAFKVISEGKQVAFVSPTTILAKQHYKTALARMGEFGVNVCSLTRFESEKQISSSLAALASGKMDMAVGTHRLLSKDVQFSDLGLLILDEEQRFGVADKEKLKRLKNNVNVLTLSATPIPRTLHMSMTGIRDMSILSQPPSDRIPVQTYVSEYSESLVYDSVMRELGRGGQVFIVYNRVETIDSFAAKIQALLGDVKIVVGHGQMKESVLERAIEDFTEGRASVLIASTIIENGIDMPRANTMIVVDADKLGLAQLYQLRGRIGRSNRLAYVFFTYEDGKILSETAFKRLEAISQFTEFGSGFKIAMRDLEIRGAGNILGKDQHGHMDKVGYDMYCKILRETVNELQGKEAFENREIKVAIDFGAFVPDSYVPDNEWRLNLYSRIAELTDMASCERLMSEIRDVYGIPPQPVRNLMATALVKNLAVKAKAVSVTFKKQECGVYFDKMKDINTTISALAAQMGGSVKISPPGVVFIGQSSQKNMINFLLKCVRPPLNS